MKLCSILMVFVAADPVVMIDRGFSPKHPKNRLARLNIFCDYLFTKTNWINPNRVNGLKKLCNRWSLKMEDKINDNDCFFYDDSIKPHGGPNPEAPAPPKNGVYVDNWDTGMAEWLPAERKRRSDAPANTGIAANLWYKNPNFSANDTAEWVQVKDSNRTDYVHPDWFNEELMKEYENELCKDDCAENNDCKNECDLIVRGSGDKKIARLIKQGPWKGARSILTGFRKFGERYLSHCNGHRKGSHMNTRTQFIKRVTKKFLTHCEHEQCSRTYVVEKKFKWGKKNLKTDFAGK